jgi:hypothetical protein
MLWFTKRPHLKFPPADIAGYLYRSMAELDVAQWSPEALDLPKAVHARFREKFSLYRETNILRALIDGAGFDPLFEPALREYERIVFRGPPTTTAGSPRWCSVVDALNDLGARMNLDEAALADVPEGNRRTVWGLKWSENWLSDIGCDEVNRRSTTYGDLRVLDYRVRSYTGRPESDGGMSKGCRFD